MTQCNNVRCAATGSDARSAGQGAALSRFTFAIGLLLACGVAAHEDLVGTRYVAPDGVDSGHCDHRDSPCRTITYAISQAQSGDGIKVAEGSYDLSGTAMEPLLFGKQGLRGGYSTEDHFHYENPYDNATKIVGADPVYRDKLLAHGFLPVDSSGNPLPASPSQVLPPADCTNFRAGDYACWNVDFRSRLALSQFSSQPASASNLWGFVDRDDNREYAVVGLNNGTAIVEVTDAAAPREVATIAGPPSAWREVKVYQFFDEDLGRHRAYAYISTEAPNGGLQVLDLSGLPNTVTLANTVRDISTSHTLYISNVDYATNMALPGQSAFLYMAGSNLNGGRYRLYSLEDPLNPQVVTTNPGSPTATTHYMHDSTSVLVTDNRTTQCDAGHNPCEVLVDFNVESVELWDVTDKAQPVYLASATYPNATYIHSGWPSADQRFIIVHDELDELRRGINTSIYTLDIGDLRAPTFVASYTGADTSTDHNGYTVGNRYYLAHYQRGLVIFDSTDPRNLREIGFLDTYLNAGRNSAGTDGVWGVYPFLPSGTILLSDIENGLFMLRRNETSSTPPPDNGSSPPPQGSSGGGGGAWNFVTLLSLGLLSLLVLLRRHLRGSLAMLAVMCFIVGAADVHAAPRLGEPEAAGFVPQRLQRLDSFMRALVDRGERAGVVTVVSRDGNIVQLGEYGQRDMENRKPMRANTIVRIYSMTEPVTAVAVMMLYEEGKLQLDDPIGNYIPALKAPQVLSRQANGKYKNVPAQIAITIRHLLTHTSGYSYEYPSGANFKRDAILGQGQTLEQMIPLLAKLPLVHEPGQRWTYGPSANVLARLVEVLSGQPFDQFLEQRIFKPLNMTDTGFRVPENKRERFAEVYTVGAQGGLMLATRLAPQAGPYDTPGKFFAGSEGLVTTALDYWHFAHMLANGGELDGTRVLSPSTVRLMLSNHIPDSLPRSSGAVSGHGFGLGMAVLTSPEGYGVAGTPGLARWGGLANTSFWIDPDKRLVAVLMTQYLPKSASRLERDFQALVYQALAE